MVVEGRSVLEDLSAKFASAGSSVDGGIEGVLFLDGKRIFVPQHVKLVVVDIRKDPRADLTRVHL